MNAKRSLSAGTLFLIPSVMILLLLASCKKDDYPNGQPPAASAFSAQVLDKWMTLQLRLMRNATGVPNQAFSRHFAYTGVAALESLKPGLSTAASWSGKWNGLAGLPVAAQAKNYYLPANVNAAMASINRNMFPNATAGDKAAIDSLENALTSEFLTKQPAAMITVSVNFGKAVAAAVFNWAETDGYKLASTTYIPPTGPGLWVPTAPAYAAPATPYWGANRTIISGSIEGTAPAPPPAYSTDPASPFYAMVKQVYDASKNLTADQKAKATFWKDVPGATSPGHWLSILQQVIKQKGSSLDKAALAYALTGTAINDALITCFKTKYQVNLVRPITYIRDVMGHSTWEPYLATPAHPEYVSAHSSLSAAAASVLQKLFGNSNTFTDHTYDYLSYPARTYNSFEAIAVEAGHSRLFAGIHYQQSIIAGLEQGKKVTENIFKNR